MEKLLWFWEIKLEQRKDSVRRVRRVFCTAHDVELDPEGLKFHVLFLNKPLQGGLDAPGDSDELTSAMIEKYVTMFKAHSELEGTLSGLSKFTRSILKICKQGQVSSVRPSFDQCIENAILRATRIIVRTISDASPRSRSRRRPSVTEAFEMQIQRGMPCHATDSRCCI